MPEISQPKNAEPATVDLYQVAERVDALSAAWQGNELPPNLTKFLPAEPPALRRLVLSELIKVDLEYRWLHHELPKRVEEYAEEFPELASSGEIPCDLIYEEYHIRCQAGESVSADEYYGRFENQAQRLRRMMTIGAEHLGSTTLVAGQRQADIEVGQQIDDFDLLVKLGKGSFGSVYLARQRSMQRLVALKISRDRGVEPQTLAQLDHPNIVRVYDQRMLADRKLQLMYMQHIPGGTLQDALQGMRATAPELRTGKIVLHSIDQALDQRGDSPPQESVTRRRLAAASWPEAVCWVGSQLASALDYAHQRGVLHRDVKPANVLLAADGSPKLVDFNVSFSSKLEGATPAAYFGGSLIYMSPEQIEAYNPDHGRQPDELDGRSDIYSLGVVLWELLTGERSFGEAQLDDCLHDTPKLLTRLADQRRAGLTADALTKLPANLPSGMREVLISCLAANAADRPETAAMLARQLELCLQPKVQKLLRPAAKSWQQRMRAHPLLFFVLIGLMPSAVFGIANFLFNQGGNHTPLEGDAVGDYFMHIEVPCVNGLLYPIAVLSVVMFAWPVLTTVSKIGKGRRIDASILPGIRRRALCVGDFAAWMGMSLWIISGIVFPGWLNLRFGGKSFYDTEKYAQFLISQIASGWISSTLTFFLITGIFVRAFYPALIRPEQSSADEVVHINRLERRCIYGLALTFTAMFFALGLMIALPGTATTAEKYWRVILPIVGFFGSIWSFWMLQLIRADLTALEIAIDPQRDAGSLGSETTKLS